MTKVKRRPGAIVAGVALTDARITDRGIRRITRAWILAKNPPPAPCSAPADVTSLARLRRHRPLLRPRRHTTWASPADQRNFQHHPLPRRSGHVVQLPALEPCISFRCRSPGDGADRVAVAHPYQCGEKTITDSIRRRIRRLPGPRREDDFRHLAPRPPSSIMRPTIPPCEQKGASHESRRRHR